MPTVIDSLVITLGLDATKFDEGQKAAVDHLRKLQEASDRHVKPVNKGMSDLVETFKLMQGQLLAIGALVATGLGFNRLVQDVTKLNTELGFTAKSLGMTAQQLSAWEQVGRTVGATSGEMSQNLAGINAQLQEFHATGNSQLAALMGRDKASGGLGIKPMQPGDTPESIALRLSKWYQEQPDKAFASHLLRTRGGLTQGGINALSLGPEELQKRLDKAKRLAPTDEEIGQFTKLTQAFGELLNVLDRLTTKALLPFVNALTKILNMLTDWLTKWAESNQTPAEAAGSGLARMGLPELKPNSKMPSLAQRSWNWLLGRPGGFSGPSGSGADNDNAPSNFGGRFGNWQGGQGAGQGGISPAPTGPGTSPEGGGAGSSAFLRQQRQGFADQLSDPGVRQRVAGMAQLEGSPQHTIESLANRFNYVNGQRAAQGLPPLSVDQMLNSGFYGPINRGQLPGAVAELRNNPQRAARMENAIQGVLNGSNLVRGYTDQGLPTDPNGSMRSAETARDHITRGGNEFTDWAGGPGGRAAARAYRERVQAGVAAEAAANAAAANPSGDAPSARPRVIIPTDGGFGSGAQTGNQRSFENWQSLGLGARGAITRGGDQSSIDNSQTSSTHVENLHVTAPPGGDPGATADGIMRRLSDYNNVEHANTGMV